MQQEKRELGLGEQINLVIALLMMISDPVLPLLRRPGSWGDRFVTVYTAAGAVMMFMWIGEFGDPIAIPAFFTSCGGFLIHRVAGLWRPKETHSRYGGRSIFPGDENQAKGVKEPIFVLVCGIFCLIFSPGLGTYLCTAGVGLAVCHSVYRMRITSQVRGMRDSRIEAEAIRSYYER